MCSISREGGVLSSSMSSSKADLLMRRLRKPHSCIDLHSFDVDSHPSLSLKDGMDSAWLPFQQKKLHPLTSLATWRENACSGSAGSSIVPQ